MSMTTVYTMTTTDQVEISMACFDEADEMLADEYSIAQLAAAGPTTFIYHTLDANEREVHVFATPRALVRHLRIEIAKAKSWSGELARKFAIELEARLEAFVADETSMQFVAFDEIGYDEGTLAFGRANVRQAALIAA